MTITGPMPFAQARAFLAAKGLLPTELSSAELAALDAAIKRNAVFSAKVTRADFLQRVFDVVARIVDPTLGSREPGSYMDKPKAREALKALLAETGYSPEAEGVASGSLQDLSSNARLNLIIDTNVRMERNKGSFVRGNTAGARSIYPAQELVRVRTSRVERGDWPARWRASGGKFFGGGRMVALKGDPVWQALGNIDRDGLGNPYPPFAFGSGMGVRDVARAEAIAFGLLAPDQDAQAAPAAAEISAGAGRQQASVSGLAPSLASALRDSLGDGFEIVNGILRLAR